MGTFDFHTDVYELPGMKGPDGLGAFGLWSRCGAWTSRHGRTGLVPHHVVAQMAGRDRGLVQVLVGAGLWRPEEGGYRMLRGPSDNPDQPLPLWRYGDGDLGEQLLAMDDAPNT